jgi:hypothetical protein
VNRRSSRVITGLALIALLLIVAIAYFASGYAG